MNDITPKEASEILSHYTDLGYGIVIEGEDTSKIKQALSFASKKLTNGTPLYINVPSANCISREAVRSKIWKERVEKDEGCNSEYIRGLKTAIAFIDNEPPLPQVTVFAENADENAVADLKVELQNVIEARPNEQIAWEQGYEAGLAQGKHERPQGEWIKIDEEWYDYKCSVCGEKVRRLYPFCHCGADMRKGDVE